MNNPRQEVLDAAARAVLQDRNASYGPPEKRFQDIADVWNWYHGRNGTQQVLITAMDVANMMILMKMARLKYNPNHRDSKVDVAGYAACAAECESSTPTQDQSPKEGVNANAVTQTELVELFKKTFPNFPSTKNL